MRVRVLVHFAYLDGRPFIFRQAQDERNAGSGLHFFSPFVVSLPRRPRLRMKGLPRERGGTDL